MAQSGRSSRPFKIEPTQVTNLDTNLPFKFDKVSTGTPRAQLMHTCCKVFDPSASQEDGHLLPLFPSHCCSRACVPCSA